MINMVRARLNREPNEKGFTLIEIIVAMLIFAILAAVAIPIYMNQQKTVVEQQINIALTNASIILKQEHAGANGRYPTMLPADVVIPNEISMVYTHSKNQDMYCLEASYANDSDTARYLKGDDAGNSDISETECTYTSTGPAAPVLSGDINTANQPMLSWTAISGATSYTVENITTGDTFTVASGTSWTGDLITVPESFRVITHVDSARSDASNVVRLTPPSIRPTSTPILTLNNVSGNNSQRSGTLNWNPIKWADEYVVMNADTNAELWRGPTYTLDVSAKIGETLRVYIVAINDTGQSPQSNVVTLTGPSPTAPNLNLTTTTGSTGTTAKLTWNSVPGATKYHLFKNGSRISTNAVSGVTDLTAWNNGAINFYVLPVASSGMTGDRSNEVSYDSTMPIPSVPAAPTGEYRNVLGSMWRYAAEWEPSDFAHNYEAQHRTNSGAWVYGPVTPSTGIGLLVKPGDKIEVRVRASNYAGTSGWSSIHTYTHTIQNPVFSSSSRSGQNFTLVATCPLNETHGRVQYRHNASGSMTGWTSSTDATRFTVPTNSLYGHETEVEARVFCHSDHDTSVRGNGFIVRSWEVAARTIPKPTGISRATTSASWSNADSSVAVAVAVAPSPTCPAGTTGQWRYKHGPNTNQAPYPWSGWMNTGSNAGNTSRVNLLGDWARSTFYTPEVRCVLSSDNTITSDTLTSSRTQVNRPIPKPTSVSVSMVPGSTGTANLYGNCPGGTQIEYQYERFRNGQYVVGQTLRNSQVSLYGPGDSHSVRARCLVINSSAQGPWSNKATENYGGPGGGPPVSR